MFAVRCTALVSAAVALSVAAVPAAATAQDSTPSEADYTRRYSSLSAALVEHYAASQQMSLADFAAAHSAAVDATLGVQGAAATLPTSGAALTSQLPSFGQSLNAGSFTSLDALLAEVRARSGVADARVVAAGATYSAQLSRLRAPALAAPAAAKLDTTLATSMPRHGLAFGLFANRSLTALVRDYPDVYAQVSRSGVVSPQAQQAWEASMKKAYQASQTDFTAVMPAPCEAAALSVLASGNFKTGQFALSGKNKCAPCITQGLYAHHAMRDMVTVVLPAAKPATPLDGARTAGVQSRQVDDHHRFECQDASAAAKSTLGPMLPRILEHFEAPKR